MSLLRELAEIITKAARISRAVNAFVNTDSWADAKRVVKAHPELLTDEADELLAGCIEKQEDARAIDFLKKRRQILAQCRSKGIDEALSELESASYSGHHAYPSDGIEAEISRAPHKVQEIVRQLGRSVQDPRQQARRLQLLEQALVLVDRRRLPELWATLQADLASSLLHMPTGIPAENVERAIAAYTVALGVYTRTGFPIQWAVLQSNLGIAYANRIQGDRAENLECAIAACSAALEIRTRTSSPVDWALTQNNLGGVYSKRIRGDRAQNLELAIASLNIALRVLTQADFPSEWAAAQSNLGEALRQRLRGDRAENLERAIAAYKAALEIYTRADSPVDWAGVQANLGLAYMVRVLGEKAENIDRAIAVHNAALEVYARTDFPVEWARVQSNLSGVYLLRTRGNREENLERAIAACTSALQVYSRADFPEDWAGTQNNLASALCERARGDRAENVERAIAAYRCAIAVHRQLGIRDEERRTAGNLGFLHYREGQWAAAYAALDTAVRALEAMRAAYFSEEAKTTLSAESALLYARMTDTCLHLGRPREALERAEAGKGRLFLDQLGTDSFPAPSLSSQQRPLLRYEAQLISELRALGQAIRIAHDEVQRRQYTAKLSQKAADLDQVWTQLEPHAPDYVVLRRGDPVEYGDLQAVVDDFDPATALVEFYTLPDKILVFILRPGEREPAVATVPMSEEQLGRHTLNCLLEVIKYPRSRGIGQRWQELAEPLLRDVLPLLQGMELIYLVPHGPLHNLPLHALQVDGSYLVDRFPIVYVPSASVLSRILQRRNVAQTDTEHRALVLGYTPNEPEREVFEGEAIQVAQFFGTRAYLGTEATAKLIREKGVEYETLHLSCHAFQNLDDPLASGLILADGVLTARDIMGLRLNAEMVTLSACETAPSEINSGDELMGLPRAFLYAGTSSVLAAQWSVDAVTTLDLMSRFYRRLLGRDGAKSKAPAFALRDVMLDVRKTKEHPYYWAPFILVGDWR